MAYFTVTEVNGPHWDPARQRRDQHGWTEHAAFMDTLVDDGYVILGGPIGAGDRVLLVVEAADEAELLARLGRDPWLVKGVLAFGAVEPWTVWLDARRR